jgi:hypothetical protein
MAAVRSDEIGAVQLLARSFDEYQEFHADIVQTLLCAGIGQTSLIRATDPRIPRASTHDRSVR